MEKLVIFGLYSEEPGEDPQLVGFFRNKDMAVNIMSQLIDRDLDYLQGVSEEFNFNSYPIVWESTKGTCVAISTRKEYDDPSYDTETEQIMYYVIEESVCG